MHPGALPFISMSQQDCATHCCCLPPAVSPQVRAALVAAFGADATAKLAPLIQKFDDAVNAAGGVEALAAQATDKLNELLPGAGDAVGGLLGAAGGLLGGLTGGGGEGGGNTSRGFGSALFSVALQMLTDPGVMQAVSGVSGVGCGGNADGPPAACLLAMWWCAMVVPSVCDAKPRTLLHICHMHVCLCQWVCPPTHLCI